VLESPAPKTTTQVTLFPTTKMAQKNIPSYLAALPLILKNRMSILRVLKRGAGL
jgi:hypothetical protein